MRCGEFNSYWRANRLSIGLIFGLALLFLWPLVIHPLEIPMTAVLQATDFLVTHLAYAQYIHSAWVQYGYLPLWNSSMFSGMPLVADPLAGYFYLPNWLTFLFPTPLAFNLLSLLHLVWSGLGLYLFLRKDQLHPVAALFGAAAWMGTPRLMAYLGDGQMSSFFALAWLPWLLLAIDRMAKEPRLRSGALAGAVLATIILIDIRWGFFAGLFAVFYLTSRWLGQKGSYKERGQALLAFLVLSILLTAVLILPLAELALHSSRSSLTARDLAIFSFDFTALTNLFAPQTGLLFELISYMGVSTLFLLCFGISRANWYWLVLILICSLYAFGKNAFLFPIIIRLVPGLTWLRVPSRLWFFVAFGSAILSAQGFNRLLLAHGFLRLRRWFAPFSFALGLFTILLAVGMSRFTSPLPPGLVALAINMPAILVLLNLTLYRPQSRLLYLVLPLLVADLLWYNSSIFRSVPLPNPPPAAAWLEKERQSALFRVYSPSYSLPLPNPFQSADGVNPLHLEDYTRFMHAASNLETGSYSVSLPEILIDPRTAPEVIEALSAPNTNLLGLLNVKYLISNVPLRIPTGPAKTFGDTYIYRNPSYRERAWMDGTGQVNITAWSPDHISLHVDSPGGLVVLSEVAYPGWLAWVDQVPTPVKTVENLLRAVQVPPGQHEIIFAYRPILFYIGSMISGLGWAIFFYIFIVRVYVKTRVASARSSFS